MTTRTIIIGFAIGSIFSFWMMSCEHEPMLIEEEMMPVDTMTIDTMTVDTSTVDTTSNGVPCDPDVIYFETDILPLLHSNCAFSGCHDAASAEDGVILESYETVIATADVEPFNLDDSEIYEVLVDDDIGDRMPPSPTPPLSQDKIQLIALWILQGGQNLTCDPDLEPCDAESVSYSMTVEPIISLYCEGCHSGNPPSGGIDLSTYDGLKGIADNGKLVGAISWDAGFENMPKNADQLPSCEIDQIKSWVDAGALNN